MYGGAWMWNPNKIEEFKDDDESWEVKAFEQDIKDNISGTTWPPRYTCHFCRREFRSAQALGGHMNIHRRDRVSSRAHQGPTAAASSRSGSGTLVHSCAPPLPTTRVMIQSTASNIESLSHFYQLQNPSGSYDNSGHMTNLYGTTSFPSSNLAFPVFDYPAEVSPRLIEHSTRDDDGESYGSMKGTTGISVDEPDLELRLGHNPP